MALNKQINTVYGVFASYWKITHVDLDRINGSSNLIVSGYFDKNTRDSGFDPLKILEFYIDPSTFAQISSNTDVNGDIVSGGYIFLKSQPEFLFAEDC